MKTRDGFVSNSSSTSFCIVGVERQSIISELMEKDGFVDDGGYGVAGHGKNGELIYYGRRFYNDGVMVWDTGAVGVEAKELLERMTLPQARHYVRELLKNIGVDVRTSDIDLRYGEASNE